MEEKNTQYRVTGMSCAACVSHVEKAVKAVKGVEAVAVNLLTESMQVAGTASEKAVCDAVKKAGYGAFPKGKETVQPQEEETSRLGTRLLISLCFLLPLMYLSMGAHDVGAALACFFGGASRKRIGTAVAFRRSPFHQQKVLHKRHGRAFPRGAQYGHLGGTGSFRRVRLQCRGADLGRRALLF